MKKLLALSAAVVLLSGQVASAALKINEIYFSPEDPKDDRQFFEVISDVGVESLDNVWLLEVEGDQPIGVGDNPGLVLNAFDLSGFSTGTNGLFLWRDSSTVLDNSSDPGVQGPAPSGLHTEAFNQIFGYEGEDDDFANNVHTFLLVQDYTGADPTTPQGGAGPGPDLDSDDDGVLDSMPWSAVLDGISATEEGEAGFQYAAQVGGLDVQSFFGPDVWHRMLEPTRRGEWLFFDSSSGDREDASFPGLFYANDSEGDAGFQDGQHIPVFVNSTFLFATPGAANYSAIPEPATLMLASIIAGVLTMIRRQLR